MIMYVYLCVYVCMYVCMYICIYKVLPGVCSPIGISYEPQLPQCIQRQTSSDLGLGSCTRICRIHLVPVVYILHTV